MCLSSWTGFFLCDMPVLAGMPVRDMGCLSKEPEASGISFFNLILIQSQAFPLTTMPIHCRFRRSLAMQAVAHSRQATKPPSLLDAFAIRSQEAVVLAALFVLLRGGSTLTAAMLGEDARS